MRKEAFAYTMPKHAFAPVLGQFRRWTLDSTLLENRLGDTTEREVLTHVSPEGMALLSEGQTLPVLIYLAPSLLQDQRVLDGKHSLKRYLNGMSGW